MAGRKYNALWQQTMMRIKNPKISVPFYEKNFGMKLVHQYDFPQWKFSLYFMERPRQGASLPPPGTRESEAYLWNMQGTTLELTHNHGAEDDAQFSVWSGNEGCDLPKDSPLYKEGVVRGFGHIAFNVEDVVKGSADLEKDGVKFRKRPHEGRMKDIAFAEDPDGYWVELVKRSNGTGIVEPQNFSQTMLRIKDADKSLAFYRDVLGMTLVRAMHFPGDFSNYFLACLSNEEAAQAPHPESPEAADFVNGLWQPCLELTHNHGTENDADFHVHTGNTAPQGFGHIGYLVDDLKACCGEMQDVGVPFFKKPEDGNMHQIAFALDPDGYRVEIVQRDCSFAGVCSNF
mmetsp:Transcript_28309/g.51099  ORF Transcript_28309/g.51099 Transcript_28309/m.51099 type:complete len:345 (-) Transcript_28309:104-1138(-)